MVMLSVIYFSFIIPSFFFFFNDTATTEIYTLSLHDALPIFGRGAVAVAHRHGHGVRAAHGRRSEEHTSELQSRLQLVCRLLLEKKNAKAALGLLDSDFITGETVRVDGGRHLK